MRDAAAVLTALQFGDGLFPNGGFAFSSGLETLWREQRLGRREVASFIVSQVDARWGPCDRVALAGAHYESGNPIALAVIDSQIEALAWPELLRKGSKQAGAALLASASRLEMEGAVTLREATARGELHGHLPVIQGVLLREAGVDVATTMAISGHQFVAGQANAAVRLGAIGAIEAQRIVARARPRLQRWIERAVGPPWACSSFSPEADIAMMRHARRDTRLFVN